MSETAEAETPGETTDNVAVPELRVPQPHLQPDFASILGLSFALGLIVFAVAMGQSDASFFNVPSLMIVVFGTMAATSVSYTIEELILAIQVIRKSLIRRIQRPRMLAESLLDMAVIAKKKGILSLMQYETQLEKDPFLFYAIQLVSDGYQANDIDHILTQDIEAQIERHKRSASITRRASETAPAMGLIGTLVGLVQMLADLENPETIGPAMAVALLTTFYGAILGTVVMAPLTLKLEKNSQDETLSKTLIKTAAISISKLENPRHLEMLLNSELPPSARVQYFD